MDKLTDREILLIAYGALKARLGDADVTKVVEEHLFTITVNVEDNKKFDLKCDPSARTIIKGRAARDVLDDDDEAHHQ